MHGIEAQQMGVGFHRAQVIDGDDLHIRAATLQNGSQDEAADATKAIDGDANGHFLVLL
jgi:hypothetical protein